MILKSDCPLFPEAETGGWGMGFPWRLLKNPAEPEGRMHGAKTLPALCGRTLTGTVMIVFRLLKIFSEKMNHIRSISVFIVEPFVTAKFSPVFPEDSTDYGGCPQ